MKHVGIGGDRGPGALPYTALAQQHGIHMPHARVGGVRQHLGATRRPQGGALVALARAAAAVALLVLLVPAVCPIPKEGMRVDATAPESITRHHHVLHRHHCTADVLLEHIYMITLPTSVERLAHARRVAAAQQVQIKFWPGTHGIDLDHEYLKQEAAPILRVDGHKKLTRTSRAPSARAVAHDARGGGGCWCCWCCWWWWAGQGEEEGGRRRRRRREGPPREARAGLCQTCARARQA